MNKSELSRVYKVTFSNGDTHYGRVVLSKNYSAKTYLSDMAGRVLINANNPIRVNMTTEVEKRVHAELSTTTCEIVFEGPTSEAIVVKDTLAAKDLKSLNLRTNVVMGESKDTIEVPTKHSKILRNTKGEILNYISVTYAKLHNLNKYLDETKRHPMDKSFTQIRIPIVRCS
jgi:uncharacterized protein YlaI